MSSQINRQCVFIFFLLVIVVLFNVQAISSVMPVIVRSRVKHVHIWGMYNTGTNTYENVVRALLARFGVIVEAGTVLRWKHMPPYSPIPVPFPPKHSTTLHIIVIRHPLAWLRSTMTNRYNIMCQDPEGYDCTLSLSRRQQMKQSLKDVAWHFPNMAKVWNWYYGNYTSMAINRTDIIMMRYEDLLENPVSTMNAIVVDSRFPYLYKRDELTGFIAENEARNFRSRADFDKFLENRNITHFENSKRKWQEKTYLRLSKNYVKLAKEFDMYLCQIHNYTFKLHDLEAYEYLI